MNDKMLKKEFIKYFGIDKWNQEEVLSKLYIEEIFICNLLKVDPIPIIFENLENSYAQFNIMEGYITLSNKLMEMGYEKILESTIHELRHYMQTCRVLDFPDEHKYQAWKYEITEKVDPSNIIDYYLSNVEIDAYAFTQVMLEYVYELPYTKLPKGIQKIINEYKLNNNLFEEIIK